MQVVPLFSAAEIEARIAELAVRLYRDYADSPVSVLAIAEGATRFVEALTSELARHGVAPEVHSVYARRSGRAPRGAVQVDAFDPSVLDGRDVLLVVDVVGEGAKLAAVLEVVGMAETRSVRTASLIGKRARRREGVDPDYTVFEVDGGWIVGFGMGGDGELRDLDEIGRLLDDS